MLKPTYLKRALLILTILCLIPVFVVTWSRVAIEGQTRVVQFILDSEEVWQMVQRLPDAPANQYAQTLAQFRAAGADSLAIYPISLSSLEERGLAVTYDWKEITQAYKGGGFEDFSDLEQPQLAHWYVLVEDVDLAEQLEEVLGDREDTLSWRFLWGDERLLLEIPSIYWNDYRRAGLWYDEQEIALGIQLGFTLIPRTASLPGQTKEQIMDTFKPFANSRTNLILPTGNFLNGVLGVRGTGFSNEGAEAQAFVDLILQQGWTYGLIENMNQLDSIRFQGDATLLEQSDFAAVRVYAIQRAELDKENWLDSNGIVDRWFRAVVDRNIRGIYVRLFSGELKDPVRILELNQSLIRRSTAQILAAGYSLGQAIPLQPLHLVNQLLILAPILGLAGAWLLITLNPNFKSIWLIIFSGGGLLLALTLGFLGRAGAPLGGSWITIRQILGLAAHVIYPVLAGALITLIIERIPTRSSLVVLLLEGASIAISAFVITLLGGLNLGLLLTDNLFMLELQYFRGVKVSYVLPLVLYAIWFFVRYGLVLKRTNAETQGRRPMDYLHDLKRLFQRPLTLGLTAALGVVALFVWYYLGRSGHDAGVAISNFELEMRTFLETILVARPRNKEFLIGYPILMLMPFCWRYAKLKWTLLPLGTVAMTGLISVVNSFAHIRTPLMISIERSFYGLIIGLFFGAVLVLCGFLVIRIMKTLGWDLESEDA